jgi:glycosyltransferase involved in cell wall biosynthesis
MRIAIIGVGILAGKGSQGIPAFHAAINELSKQHSVVVYSFIPIRGKLANVKIRSVPFQRMPQKLQYVYLGARFLMDHLQRRHDVIHAQSPFPAGVMARFFRRYFSIPWVLSFHAGEAAYMPEVPYGDLLNPFLRKVNTEVSNDAQLITCMSGHQQQMIRRNLSPSASIKVLPRGIVMSSLREKQLRSPYIFLHVSYYQPVKGLDMLLQTFKSLVSKVDCKLIIAGRNYGEEVDAMIDSLGLTDHITIKGPLANADVTNEMSNADFLLHTSFCEGLPMVAIEAMAHGVVVCGTHTGIMADLAPDKCLTVHDRNPELLADQILKLARNEALYFEVRKKAWQWCSDHDMKWYIAELLKCYQLVVRR